jgi:hypothetical protein
VAPVGLSEELQLEIKDRRNIDVVLAIVCIALGFIIVIIGLVTWQS